MTAVVALVALLVVVMAATFLSMGLLDWCVRAPLAVAAVALGYLAGPLCIPVVDAILRFLVWRYKNVR